MDALPSDAVPSDVVLSDAGASDVVTNEASAEAGFRVERDSMGEVLVPKTARFGAQTQRAVANFPISNERVPAELIRALALIKAAAAKTNAELGIVATDVAGAIADVATEVAAGAMADEFPVDVFQTGSGTSTNMNMNEVLASLAGERLSKVVAPNDEVNATQSSNDTFPTAIHVAAALILRDALHPALARLEAALRQKSGEFAEVVKAGRTHLMDATPVTLGQEFAGYARAIELAQERIRSMMPRLLEVPLGGTAVGTGLNAPVGFARSVIERVAEATGLELREARDHFEAQGARDAIVELSGVLRGIALSLYKVSNDLRWMASGPGSGLAEIHLPDLQPGSSIMPGKVNPVVPEAVCQVVAAVIGNDAAIVFAAASSAFELNVMMPVMARALLESIRLLASSSMLFAERCIEGITADAEHCLELAMSSSAIATALNPAIGYERAAEVVKRAALEHRDLASVVLEMGLMTAEAVAQALDVRQMTRGGIISS